MLPGNAAVEDGACLRYFYGLPLMLTLH